MAGTARLMAVSARRGISRESVGAVVTVRGKHHVPKRLDLVGAARSRSAPPEDSRSRPLIDIQILEASVAGGLSHQLLVSAWRVSRKN